MRPAPPGPQEPLPLTFSMKYCTIPPVPVSLSSASTENTTEPTGRFCKKGLFTCVSLPPRPWAGPSGEASEGFNGNAQQDAPHPRSLRCPVKATSERAIWNPAWLRPSPAQVVPKAPCSPVAHSHTPTSSHLASESFPFFPEHGSNRFGGPRESGCCCLYPPRPLASEASLITA